ncbi:squalene synthase HpnD, partial [Pseudoroseomonas aestuarii]
IVAEGADAAFAAADALLAPGRARALKPARLMLLGYHALLRRMRAQGFEPPRRRPRLGRAEKLAMALRTLRP